MSILIQRIPFACHVVIHAYHVSIKQLAQHVWTNFLLIQQQIFVKSVHSDACTVRTLRHV